MGFTGIGTGISSGTGDGTLNSTATVRASANYNANVGEHVVMSGGNVVNLPDPVTDGYVMVSPHDVGSTPFVQDPRTGETIEGDDGVSVTAEYPVVFLSDGSNWYVSDASDTSLVIPDSAVDNFDQPLYEEQNKTLSDYYSGDLAAYSRVTSPVHDGSHALKFDSSSSFRSITSSAGSGLLNYPSSGDTITYRSRLTSTGAKQQFHFATQSGGYYDVSIDSQNGRFVLRKNDGGLSDLDNKSASWPRSEWIEIVIDWGSSGSITATAYDTAGSQIQQVSATDTTFSNGGINFTCNGGVNYLDTISI